MSEPITPSPHEQKATVLASRLGLSLHRFEDRPPTLVAGLAERYTPQTRQQIPQLWDRFAPHIGRTPGQLGRDSYGVCWNAQSEGGFQYLAGVEVATAETLPPDFTTVPISAGRFAVFDHSGHVSAIAQTIDAVWSKWAPACGLELGGGPCFERYAPQFDPATGLGGMELWIPLA